MPGDGERAERQCLRRLADRSRARIRSRAVWYEHLASQRGRRSLMSCGDAAPLPVRLAKQAGATHAAIFPPDPRRAVCHFSASDPGTGDHPPTRRRTMPRWYRSAVPSRVRAPRLLTSAPTRRGSGILDHRATEGRAWLRWQYRPEQRNTSSIRPCRLMASARDVHPHLTDRARASRAHRRPARPGRYRTLRSRATSCQRGSRSIGVATGSAVTYLTPSGSSRETAPVVRLDGLATACPGTN